MHYAKNIFLELVTVRRISIYNPPDSAKEISQSQLASQAIHKIIQRSPREMFIVVHMDARNLMISAEVMTVGTAVAAVVHPREVFQASILAGAVSIICGHNHPSGNAAPSEEDHAIHKRLSESGEILGIPVLDSVIVTEGGRYFSFADDKFGNVEARDSDKPAANTD